ncbi:MAG: hypothetical protein PHN51_11835 [Candidatus Nanopelagicales bacterium]|nr:hypothetical protein [Candidatus Nanopelagicales bacterium]
MMIGDTHVADLSTNSINRLLSSSLTKLDNQAVRRLVIACKVELEKRQTIQQSEEDTERELLEILLTDELEKHSNLGPSEKKEILHLLLGKTQTPKSPSVVYDAVHGLMVQLSVLRADMSEPTVRLISVEDFVSEVVR